MVYMVTRKFKYYTNDLFDPEKFFEISEEDFDNSVVKYRNLFSMKYDSEFNRIFVNNENPFNIYKVVTV